MQHWTEKLSGAATHTTFLGSYVRWPQCSEQFRRVRVQTLLKAPLTMASILCLKGADPTYRLTADCTTAVFSRLVCSVQTMEVNYALHKPNQSTTKQQHKHLLLQMCSPPSPRSWLVPPGDRAPVWEQLTVAMFLTATRDSLKAAKKCLSLRWELHLKEQKGKHCYATSVALC